MQKNKKKRKKTRRRKPLLSTPRELRQKDGIQKADIQLVVALIKWMQVRSESTPEDALRALIDRLQERMKEFQ